MQGGREGGESRCRPGLGERSWGHAKRLSCNANGAGTAADPTLTDAWASVGCASGGGPPLAHLPDTLVARCLAPARSALRPCGSTGICHRRSHRHPASACAFAALRRDAESTSPSLFKRQPGRDRLPLWRNLERVCATEAAVSRASSARLAACPAAPYHALLKDGRLAFGRSLVHAVSSCTRGQVPPPSSSKNRFRIRALRLFVSAMFRPEDSLKVRLNRRSGKHRNPDLSTFPQFACGQGWISQRFVAFVIKRFRCGNETARGASDLRGPAAGATPATRLTRRDCAGPAAAA